MHVLAHVRLAGPGTVYAPRYVAWVEAHAAAEHTAVLREGAAALERAWGRDTPTFVHSWPLLHRSIESLRESVGTPFASLEPAQVGAPGILRALRGLDPEPTQRLHALLGEAADGHAELWRRHAAPQAREALARVGRWWDDALELVPSLVRSRVELCHALGPRGRVFGERIVVGAPAPWNELDARVPVVLAMHEQLVHDAAGSGYVEVEWASLTGLSARMRRAPPALREAHGAWLASLHLRPLLEAVRAAGRLDADLHRALEHEPPERARILAACADHSIPRTPRG